MESPKPELKLIHTIKKKDLIVNLHREQPKSPATTSAEPDRQGKLGVHTGVFIVSAKVGDRFIRPLREPKNKDQR